MNKYLDKIAQQLKEEAHPEYIGIDLAKGTDPELHKWLIAVTLASKPIQRTVAARAAKQLSMEGLTSPEAIQKAGYDELVKALGRGHYVHYDFSMADTLLSQAEQLRAKYGSISNLVAGKTPHEIQQEIRALRGIGPLGSKLFAEGVSPHLSKFTKTKSVDLQPINEHTKRLREILVNSSRKGSFNPYSSDRYDWDDFKEIKDSEGKLIAFHLKDKHTGTYAILEHPSINKYKLRENLINVS
jgi:hypothetical protein